MTSSGLFAKFTLESVSQMANINATEQRRIRSDLIDQFPDLSEEQWEEILPKKSDVTLVRCHNAVHIVTILGPNSEALFFQHHSGDFIPHLRLLHKYPFMLPNRHTVDIGGCKFVVSGANVMCPGLTSEGGTIGEDIDSDSIVAIYIEGKKHAVAVGKTTMSSEDIAKINKGVCIENIHHLGDGLWMNYRLN